MKRVWVLFLFVFVAFTVSASAAELSAKKVIERYQKALGGKAIKRVKNTVMAGTLGSSDGAMGRFAYKLSAPDRLRVDFEIAAMKISECYNGKSAWRMDARGLRTLLGAEAKRLRLESLLANTRLFDLSRHRVLAAAPVKTTVEGRDAYTIEFSKDDVRLKLFFDAMNFLLVKQERETGDGVEEIFYSDYRAVDGVQEPFVLRLKTRAGELTAKLESVEHNRLSDEQPFRYPQTENAKPIPELEPLLKVIFSNQERIEKLREQYTCRMTAIERKLDGSGRVKETETKVYDVTPIGRYSVERLISVNGKALTASEQEKEDKRVQKEVEEILKRREKEARKREKAEARGETDEDDDREVSLLDFLRISQVSSVRREKFRGYEVLAFDFEPRKGFKPKTRAESIVSKLAGTLWVDESAQQIARLEARFTDSFKMAGGLLASISPSTAFVFEQEKIEGEVWLPSFTEGNISARVMLFAKFNRSFEQRFSEYKKQQIDSTYELSKPKEAVKPEEKKP